LYGKLVAHESVKPKKATKAKWDAVFSYREESRNGAEAYVVKVMFDDGTHWIDDGSHACRGESKERSKNVRKSM
jgi:hypothetical protein